MWIRPKVPAYFASALTQTAVQCEHPHLFFLSSDSDCCVVWTPSPILPLLWLRLQCNVNTLTYFASPLTQTAVQCEHPHLFCLFSDSDCCAVWTPSGRRCRICSRGSSRTNMFCAYVGGSAVPRWSLCCGAPSLSLLSLLQKSNEMVLVFL